MVTPQILSPLNLISPGLAHRVIPCLPLLELLRVHSSGGLLSILLKLRLVVFLEGVSVESSVVEAFLVILVLTILFVNHRHKCNRFELSVFVLNTLIETSLVMHGLHALDLVIFNEVVFGVVSQ